MARIRSIKPEFFESEDVAALPLRARLTWIGLWVHCDNYGRCKDNTRLVKKNVWPLDSDVSLRDVEDDLAVLADHGRIVRYEVDGRSYLAVANWSLHQAIARPGAPKHPAPPLDIAGMSRHDSDTTVTSTALVIGEQGTGNREQGGDARERASPPPPRCPKHVDNPTTEACGACGAARRAREQWEKDQADTVRSCKLCNLDGYKRIPGTGRMVDPPERCDHGGTS